MSPRYYIISALLVFSITAGISVWKQKRTKREIGIVLFQVTLSFVVLLGTVAGVAKLMEVFGVAQSGFVF